MSRWEESQYTEVFEMEAEQVVRHHITRNWQEPETKITVETMSKGFPKITIDIKGSNDEDVARRTVNALADVKKRLIEGGYTEA